MGYTPEDFKPGTHKIAESTWADMHYTCHALVRELICTCETHFTYLRAPAQREHQLYIDPCGMVQMHSMKAISLELITILRDLGVTLTPEVVNKLQMSRADARRARQSPG